MREIIEGQNKISEELGIDSSLAAHMLALATYSKDVTTKANLATEHPSNLPTARENVL